MFCMNQPSPFVATDGLPVKEGTFANQAGKTGGMINLVTCLHLISSHSFSTNPTSFFGFPFHQIDTIRSGKAGNRKSILPAINQQGYLIFLKTNEFALGTPAFKRCPSPTPGNIAQYKQPDKKDTR
jgi:hypothetical protein